jgi:hypothetical protein
MLVDAAFDCRIRVSAGIFKDSKLVIHTKP